MKLDIQKLREKYKVFCIMNNLPEHEQGFKGYISDQKMLERGRKLRRKREQWTL